METGGRQPFHAHRWTNFGQKERHRLWRYIPQKEHFFVHLQSELHGEGSLDGDDYSFKPWHVTDIQPRQGDRPIFEEEPTIPLRLHHYTGGGSKVTGPHV